jgi:FtsZ-interacting cell division protein ZipA
VDTWLIVLIVVVVVVLLAVLALAMARRTGAAKVRKQEQAREHLQEAQVRAARADQQQALAEEQAARARREQAEAQERAARAEQEAREMQASAHEDRSAAEELRAKAEKLAPGLTADRPGDGHGIPDGAVHGTAQDSVPQGRTAESGLPQHTQYPDGGSTRR